MNKQISDQALFAALDARESEPVEHCNFTQGTDSQAAAYQSKAVAAAAAAGISAPTKTTIMSVDGGRTVESHFPFARVILYLYDSGECAYSEVDANSRYFAAFIEGFTA